MHSRRLGPLVLVLVSTVIPALVSADMVVFWGSSVVERSTVRVDVVRSAAGSLQVNVYWGAGLTVGSAQFVCAEPWDDTKAQDTATAALTVLDTEKRFGPADIFKKAGLTGCTLLQK